MSQDNETQAQKGSIGNPYTHSEFLELLHKNEWKGDFVKIDKDTTIYVFANGNASRPGIWGIDGSKFTSGSDFFDNESGSSSSSGSGSGSGSSSGSNDEDGTEPRVIIRAGEKSFEFIDQYYTCIAKFKWTDGFYMENTQECTSDLSCTVARISLIEKPGDNIKRQLSGYTLKAEWAGAYNIYAQLKIVYLDERLQPSQNNQYITISEGDLHKRGY